MTFDQLCEDGRVTADEREQLVIFLAMFRATATIKALSKEEEAE